MAFLSRTYSNPTVPCWKAMQLWRNLLPPHCSSHTVNRLVLLVSSGSRLLHSITTAWGIIMTQETSQIKTILLRALLAVLLNFSGWQIAYQRSWAMQLSVRTDTDTEIVWKRIDRELKTRDEKWSKHYPQTMGPIVHPAQGSASVFASFSPMQCFILSPAHISSLSYAHFCFMWRLPLWVSFAYTRTVYHSYPFHVPVCYLLLLLLLF